MDPLTKAEIEQILRAKPNEPTGVKRECPNSDGEISGRSVGLFDAKELGSPVKRVQDLCKRHLDRAGVPGNPVLTNVRKSDYVNSPLGKAAAEYKKEIDASTGRNAGFLFYLSPQSKEVKYVRAITAGAPSYKHSELKCADELPMHVTADKIVLVYTERAPCIHGSNCTRKLHYILGETTQVVFSVEHTREGEAKLRKLQEELGVRPANKARRNLHLDSKLEDSSSKENDNSTPPNVQEKPLPPSKKAKTKPKKS